MEKRLEDIPAWEKEEIVFEGGPRDGAVSLTTKDTEMIVCSKKSLTSKDGILGLETKRYKYERSEKTINDKPIFKFKGELAPE